MRRFLYLLLGLMLGGNLATAFGYEPYPYYSPYERSPFVQPSYDPSPLYTPPPSYEGTQRQLERDDAEGARSDQYRFQRRQEERNAQEDAQRLFQSNPC
jgi:hypothetical protein